MVKNIQNKKKVDHYHSTQNTLASHGNYSTRQGGMFNFLSDCNRPALNLNYFPLKFPVNLTQYTCTQRQHDRTLTCFQETNFPETQCHRTKTSHPNCPNDYDVDELFSDNYPTRPSITSQDTPDIYN